MAKIIGDYEDKRQDDPHGEQEAKRRRRAEDLAAKAAETDAKGVFKELGGRTSSFKVSMQNMIEIQDEASPDYQTLQAIAEGGRDSFKTTYITEAASGMGREHVDVEPEPISTAKPSVIQHESNTPSVGAVAAAWGLPVGQVRRVLRGYDTPEGRCRLIEAKMNQRSRRTPNSEWSESAPGSVRDASSTAYRPPTSRPRRRDQNRK